MTLHLSLWYHPIDTNTHTPSTFTMLIVITVYKQCPQHFVSSGVVLDYFTQSKFEYPPPCFKRGRELEMLQNVERNMWNMSETCEPFLVLTYNWLWWQIVSTHTTHPLTLIELHIKLQGAATVSNKKWNIHGNWTAAFSSFFFCFLFIIIKYCVFVFCLLYMWISSFCLQFQKL